MTEQKTSKIAEYHWRNGALNMPLVIHYPRQKPQRQFLPIKTTIKKAHNKRWANWAKNKEERVVITAYYYLSDFHINFARLMTFSAWNKQGQNALLEVSFNALAIEFIT